MQKEVIYLDNEDDITTIINKLKSASARIVALVPPKRVGVLQSAVNLRLLTRTAEQSKKRLVIVTNSSALTALAASAKIPVAKNLQSKPEIPQIAALDIDEGDDIIDGINLPVGEHVAIADEKEAAVDQVVGEVAIKETTQKAVTKKSTSKDSKKKAVPNFSSFRKKLVLIVAAIIALVGFLVWALIFAPHATIAVTMRTSDISINQLVNLTDSGDSSVDKTTLKVSPVTTEQDVSVDFEATGEKNIGEKAKGPVKFSHQSMESRTVEAGTELRTGGGYVYVLDADVVIPTSKFGPPNCFPTACPGEATGSVTAAEAGEKYNNASGGLSGSGSGVQTNFTSPTSGGTDKVVSVVTDADLDKAKKAAKEAVDKDSAEKKLTDSLSDSQVLVMDSLQVDLSDLKPSIKKDGVAKDGEATYGGTAKFTAYVVDKEELKKYLDQLLKKQLDNPAAQQVYDTGADAVDFSNFRKDGDSLSGTMSTTGKIGPKIDETEVKERSMGKRFGEVQEDLTSISGVNSIDIDLSPFWVKTIPNNVDKITVEFKVDG